MFTYHSIYGASTTAEWFSHLTNTHCAISQATRTRQQGGAGEISVCSCMWLQKHYSILYVRALRAYVQLFLSAYVSVRMVLITNHLRGGKLFWYANPPVRSHMLTQATRMQCINMWWLYTELEGRSASPACTHSYRNIAHYAPLSLTPQRRRRENPHTFARLIFPSIWTCFATGYGDAQTHRRTLCMVCTHRHTAIIHTFVHIDIHSHMSRTERITGTHILQQKNINS